MNIVDSVLVVFLSLFALRGYFRGFFRESFSLLGLILGLVVAVRYDEPVAVLWKSYWNVSPTVLRAVTFVSLFFLVYFVSNLAGLLLHHWAGLLFLQTVNRAGGVALGIGKGAVLLAVILFSISSSSWIPQDLKKNMDQSYLVTPLRQFGRTLAQITKTDLLKQEEAGTRQRRALTSFEVNA